tara:strand:- start:1535 stop:1750 length:216 start_codon:yes stop_codon:yes gene_type:complete
VQTTVEYKVCARVGVQRRKKRNRKRKIAVLPMRRQELLHIGLRRVGRRGKESKGFIGMMLARLGRVVIRSL